MTAPATYFGYPVPPSLAAAWGGWEAARWRGWVHPVTPDTYLGAAVPPDIATAWNTWDGAAWRKMRYRDTNRVFPPDERCNVHPPDGMCGVHLRSWRMYRNSHFDPRTGNRYPGGSGSPFIVIGPDLGRELDERRCEWDEQASIDMRLVERVCLSGRSPQCGALTGRALFGCRATCRCPSERCDAGQPVETPGGAA